MLSVFNKIYPIDKEDKIKCPICLESCEITLDNTCKTSCNHYYHTICLENSLKVKNSCPICRTKITSSYTPKPECLKCSKITGYLLSFIIIFFLSLFLLVNFVIVIYIIIVPIVELYYYVFEYL